MKRRSIIVGTILLVLAALIGPLAITLGADRGSASFGDNETFGLNQLTSATVSVSVGPNTVPIDVRTMAPGDRFNGEIVIENDGTLPLRYALITELSPSTQDLLAVLEWTIAAAPVSGDCTSSRRSQVFDGRVTAATFFGNPAFGEDPGDRVIAPGRTEVLCVEVELPLGVTNAFQGAEATVDLIMLAEQATEDLE